MNEKAIVIEAPRSCEECEYFEQREQDDYCRFAEMDAEIARLDWCQYKSNTCSKEDLKRIDEFFDCLSNEEFEEMVKECMPKDEV